MKLDKYPKTVFVLGAGASFSSGAPLMNDFLDRAEQYYREAQVEPGFEEDFERVLNALNSMQLIHSKANINLDNIEDVFGTFEIAKLIGKLGSFKKSEINKLSESTKILIAHTLELASQLPLDFDRDNPRGDYYPFVQSLENSSKEFKIPFENNIFVTFNYDIFLDVNIQHFGYNIDYGLSDENIEGTVKVLKLHGSINWGICPKCKTPFEVSWPLYLRHLRDGKIRGLKVHSVSSRSTRDEIKTFFFTNFFHLYAQCSCGAPSNRFRPAIIPPTWNKTNFHSKISNVWKHAANAFGEAENILIIGYSLPETDMFFRLLYGIGSASERRLKRFWVFNPDESAKPRFDEIIGKSRIQRYEFIKTTFARALNLIVHPNQVLELPKDSNGARFTVP